MIEKPSDYKPGPGKRFGVMRSRPVDNQSFATWRVVSRSSLSEICQCSAEETADMIAEALESVADDIDELDRKDAS